MEFDLAHLPFAGRRMPVLADNGVVATGQPLAAQAGLAMLRRGGNAVDAAVATAAALTVLEPTSNGIGSDAFALVWDGARLHGYNGSGRSPAALDAAALRARGHRVVPERGWDAVTVPGAPDTWDALSRRFGRLSLHDCLAPAIDYARHGFPVSPVVAGLWKEAEAVFLGAADPALHGWARTFAPGGRAPRAGERWSSPEHAATLEAIAGSEARDFYEGAVGSAIVEHARATGGVLAAADLASHRGEWVEPVGLDYRGLTVWEIPPNGQGIAALQALGMLRDMDLPRPAAVSADTAHAQIEAMKLAFADAYRHVADPEHAEVPTAGMLDAAYLASRAACIGPRAREPRAGDPARGGTVYLCAADREGLMVSFIQSNYMGFGSGVVVPGTGVSLQNRGAGFTLREGHPNEAAGGKRPRHTIIPGFLTEDGRAVGPFGVMGGEMQPQGHLQVVCAMRDHGLNPQAALDAPRWRVTGGLGVEVEPGFDADAVAALADRGHQVTRTSGFAGFGRGQIIVRLENGAYVAGSEPRADGCAAAC